MKKLSFGGAVCNRSWIKQVLLLAILLLGGASAAAQQATGTSQPRPIAATDANVAPPPATAQTVAAATEPSDIYRIGPGDVLDIRVFNRPQLSREAVRVDGHGMIRMPLLADDIQAACRTEGELSHQVATLYLRYIKNPHVDVFVKDYNSHPVALVGAIRAPGRFQLQRRVRLLELLALAGGPSDRAGGRVQIVRANETSPCEQPAAQVAGAETSESLLALDLNDTLRGVDSANPFMHPGDIVSIPEAEQAFVVGNVLHPTPIPLRETVTVSHAIAMAGGTMPDTKKNTIRIIRQARGSSVSTELVVDLEAISHHQAEDIALLAGDIVEVPTSGGRRLLRSLLGAVVPTAAQLPVQVVR